MRKISILLLVLFVSTLIECTTDQTYSKKTFEIEKLVLIGKVWGFLKYYHPGASNEAIDWDKKLLETLRKSNNIKDKARLNETLRELIDFCNQQNDITIDTSYLTGEFLKEISYDWLQDTTYLSSINSKELMILINNREPYLNHYVSQEPSVGNLYFENEKAYADSVFPSKNLRLLSLFRYWNIINYFYPYHELNDKKWESVLPEYIPQFININDTIDYHLKVLELTSTLNDGHIWTESVPLNYHFGIYSPPYKLRYVENQPIVGNYFPDSLGLKQDLKIGDQILKINNQTIKERINNRKKYYSNSNSGQYFRRITEELLITPNKDSMKLTLIRQGKLIDINVKPYLLYDLYKIHEREKKRKKAYRIINDSIGFVDLKYLEVNEISLMMDTLMILPKIIIDIRNYPNGVLYELSKYFNPAPTEFVQIFIPNINNPGQFIWMNNIETGTYNSDYYKGKIVLIVNEQTQSHAEFTAMCLQTAPNVTTIGSPTSGTDGNVSYVILPGYIITYFTGIGIVYPDGTITQRTGVKLDSLIQPTIQDYQKGFDRLIEKAVEI